MTKNQDTTIYIVFPVHNRIDETKRFLASLSRQSVSNYKVVICDDGSTDGTYEYLITNHPQVLVLKGDGQLWWTAGINKCIRYVLSNCRDSDYILTINNDVQLPEDYLQKKLHRATEYPDAIIGSLCVYADNHDLIETSGFLMDYGRCSAKQLNRPGELRSELHKGVVEVTHVPGKGVLFPVEVFKDIGLYDEANFPQYHADTDLVLYAHERGYQVLVDFDAIVLSEVNTNNMVLPTHQVSLKGMVKTFIGPYSMNNFRIRNNFAKKHCPDKRIRYLAITYFKVIGGLIKRYIQCKLRRRKASV